MTALPVKEFSENETAMQHAHEKDLSSDEEIIQITSLDETHAEENDINEDKPQQENTTGTAQGLTKSTTTRSEKPYTSFSLPQKWFIVGMATAASFFSPLSGQIYYPVLPILAQNYHLSETLINISVTTYMIFQGLAPSFMGTFSDASGRRPGYILAFLIYTAANIGLAEQNSYAALLVLRCLQSAGSSGTVAFGYGVIADVTTTAERGKYMGPMAAGVMMGPALGPVIGGLLSQYLGWRSVFWFLVVISGSYLVVFTLFQPESHRKIVGDGSIIPVESWRLSVLQYIQIRRKLARMSLEERQEYKEEQNELRIQQKNRKLAFPNPLLSFVILLEPDAFMVIFYVGLMMFGATIMMTSLPNLFPDIYGFNELQVGLCFL
jgi:MFS family permease